MRRLFMNRRAGRTGQFLCPSAPSPRSSILSARANVNLQQFELLRAPSIFLPRQLGLCPRVLAGDCRRVRRDHRERGLTSEGARALLMPKSANSKHPARRYATYG